MGKTMKIGTTKVFADFMNKAAEKAGVRFHARRVVLTENNFRMLTGSDMWDSENWPYHAAGGGCSAIAVEYPPEYYACMRYISARELVREFRRRSVRDLAGLESMIIDMCEI